MVKEKPDSADIAYFLNISSRPFALEWINYRSIIDKVNKKVIHGDYRVLTGPLASNIINHINWLYCFLWKVTMPSQPHGPSPSGRDCSSPPDSDIRQQSEKILASPEFQSSPMLCDFLRFVVERTLSGRAQEIKGYTVATEVMGRKADFDAAKDTIMRIHSGRLRRALERYLPNPTIITEPAKTTDRVSSSCAGICGAQDLRCRG
jgi:hypothetical protein